MAATTSMSAANDRDDCISKRSVPACTAALKATPSDIQLLQMRAIGYAGANNQDAAIADYTEIIRLNPNNAESYYARSLRHNAKLDTPNAMADLDQAIRLGPSTAKYYPARAYGYMQAGDFDKAISVCDIAIKLDPKYESAFIMRSNAWREKKDYDRSVADANEAISFGGASGEAYRQRALTRIRTQDYDLAIADLNAAIEKSPRVWTHWAARGTAWRLKGDLDSALRDLNRAVEIAPMALALFSRGDVHRFRGDYAAAIADYEASFKSIAGNIPALTGLGLTYERMGERQKARQKFEEAVKSTNAYRFTSDSKIATETAAARLAVYDAPSVKKSETGGKRIALVVGNADYRQAPKLLNPVNDAEAVASSLTRAGFGTVMVRNANRELLLSKLKEFAIAAQTADWAVVYFAGYGIEVGGVNYLLPIDADTRTESSVKTNAVQLSDVLHATQSAKRIRLIILDACRDNPFVAPISSGTPSAPAAGPAAAVAGTTRSVTRRGLAEVKVQGATLVVYSAKDGQTALDGDSGNSPFATAMAQRLTTPGVEISKVFRLVRDDVMESTAGRQEPYTYGSLPGREDFYFVSN